MPKCSMRNCKNITSKTLKKDGISYFRFPRDPVRCEKWRLIISKQRREESFKENSSSVICSEHFCNEDMYVTDKGLKRLIQTALPRIMTADIPDDGCHVEDFLEDRQEYSSSPIFPNLGTIWDSPQIIVMKDELEKCRKRLLWKEKIISNLRKKKSILVKANTSLRNELLAYKKRLRVYRKSFVLRKMQYLKLGSGNEQ